jgi:UDP-N-acetylmuramate--alanine ligase
VKLENVHKVFMLGIGGIGMSAIARYLKLKGMEVSGYDRTATQVTRTLQSEGISVFFEADASHLDGVDLVIYTPAVSRQHPDYLEAVSRNIPIHKRAEILGMISRSQRTIAVAGTHGKTSTTGLITHLMWACGIECTAFIGGIAKNIQSNFIFGSSEWIVVEADEFDRSFLQLSPELAIVTSMDADHLDIYGTGDEVQNSYRAFMSRIQPGGTLFINDRLKEAAGKQTEKIVTFSATTGDRRAENTKPHGIGMQFDYVSNSMRMEGLQIHFPGRYNVENALAAISVVLAAGGTESGIRKGLDSFTGIQRRFDVQVRKEGVTYIDDYAHHPEEIRSLLNAVKDVFPGIEIIAAFQPHLFTRTRDFCDGFAASLSMADRVVLLDIYPAREEAIPGVTSKIVFDKITSANKSLTGLDGICEEIQKMKITPCVVLTVGAGDIDTKVEAVAELVTQW